jgi:hypothetical protein
VSTSRFPASWLLSAVGCGLLLSAVLWQPPFQRELTIIAVVILLLAVANFLKRLASR